MCIKLFIESFQYRTRKIYASAHADFMQNGAFDMQKKSNFEERDTVMDVKICDIRFLTTKSTWAGKRRSLSPKRPRDVIW